MKSLVLAGLALTAFAAAGCSMEHDRAMNTPAPDRRPAPAPMAAAPANPAPAPGAAVQGTGAPVSRGNMPIACRDEIAEKLRVGPGNVRVGAVTLTADGATVTANARVSGERAKNYRCRFDSAGRFVEVMALT